MCIRKNIKKLLIILLLIVLIIYFIPCISGTVKINGTDYLFVPRFSLKIISMNRIEKIRLGINYFELIAEIGKQNGELNQNAILNNIYYRVGFDKFVVFHFEYDGGWDWWENVEGGQLTGIYLYNHKECIRIIKELG